MITTILIQIILVGTNVCINVLLLCEDAVTGENQPVRLNDHMTITLAPTGYRTVVAAVKGKHVTTAHKSDRPKIRLFNEYIFD